MKRLFAVLIALMLLISSGCSSSSDPVPRPKSSEKSITSYSLNGVAGTINETERTITVAMPFGMEVTAMVATFVINGTSVKIGAAEQISGATANDFTNQITYTVTAADATTQDYTVTVIVAQSSAKAITSYSLNGFASTINETNKTIAITLPFVSLKTNKVATFATTGAYVKVGQAVQVSGTTTNDFTNPVTYTVTAADATTQDYTVTVTVALSSAKAITAFSLNGSVGTIDEANKTITVTMPYGTYVMDLVATFTTTGFIVEVNSADQISGKTAHNFTNPVTYTVVAADSSTKDYVVTVIVAPSPAKAITAYSLNGVAGTIDETYKTIAVTMPSLTNITSLVASFTTTGASVKVGSIVQASGVTANNFTSQVTYTVTAADGTKVTYIVSVTVSKAWHHPASLSDNISQDTQDAHFPQVAMDKNGNAIIVWSQSDGTKNQIYKSEFRNSIWTHPISLSDNISLDGQWAEYPQVAMDNNGNAIIVWTQNKNIYKSEYRNGVWHYPSSLSDNINPPSYSPGIVFLLERVPGNPQVAMDNNGNAIIVWAQSERETIIYPNDSGLSLFCNQIFKSEYRNGAWTHPASIDDNISSSLLNASKPQVAMDDNGNAILVWHQYYSAFFSAYGETILKTDYRNGVWSYPTNPYGDISLSQEYAIYPQVAMDNNGNAIIVWSQSDGTKNQIYKSEFRNGIWTHPISLSDNISPDGQWAEYPQVAMDNNGNVIIVWSQSDGTSRQIFKSEYRNGVWTHPANLSDNISPEGQDPPIGGYNLPDKYPPQVAMGSNGEAIIVWKQYDGTNWKIFKSEYRNSTWTHPAGLSDNISPDGQDGDFPEVAMDKNGNAIIVWQQSDGANWHIFKSEYR